jgi:hypothetical protein
VLSRLGQRGLDDEVVERHGCGELGLGPVAAQLVGHPVQAAEDLAVAPRDLVGRGLQAAGQRPVAGADDLVHEALEEDRVARLVDLLGGQEVLLLLQRRGVDEGREVVGDRVLAVEEERVEPQRRAPLLLGQALVPVDAVLAEVDLRGAPVAPLPPRVEVVVGDRVGDRRCGGGHDGKLMNARSVAV